MKFRSIQLRNVWLFLLPYIYTKGSTYKTVLTPLQSIVKPCYTCKYKMLYSTEHVFMYYLLSVHLKKWNLLKFAWNQTQQVSMCWKEWNYYLYSQVCPSDGKQTGLQPINNNHGRKTWNKLVQTFIAKLTETVWIKNILVSDYRELNSD
jgi:hypothetical protein